MRKLILLSVLFSISALIFQSCTTQDNEISPETLSYYSKEEIQDLKDWLALQHELGNEELDLTSLPELDFEPASSNTDEQIINNYLNEISYLNDAAINGVEADYSYDYLVQKVTNDDLVDQNGKSLILSFIQLSEEFFTLDSTIDFYQEDNSTIEERGDPCNCGNLFELYDTYQIMCAYYGHTWPQYCTWANTYYVWYVACTRQEISCPSGFNFDGANCHSGVYFPSGYTPFIWANAFYTKQNCNISWANNCCPSGFNFDGANCHSGIYFPSNYEPFIYANAFYVKPKCL